MREAMGTLSSRTFPKQSTDLGRKRASDEAPHSDRSERSRSRGRHRRYSCEGRRSRGRSRSGSSAPSGNFTTIAASRFSEWPLYNLGLSFDGLALVAILRNHVTNPVDPEVTKIRPNDVSFIYGDCVATDDSGCAPPLEITISPSCLFTPDDIDRLPSSNEAVRGVGAAFYGPTHAVIVAGRSTIDIYGQTHRDVLAAANALRGVNVALGEQDDFPPPNIGTPCR